jgi:hypothetical protein
MPFTLSHPAAALPLLRPLGRYGVLSALVIGSLVPDLAYFIPLTIARNESHSITGLFLFCFPAGFVSYILFHVLFKGPLLGLLPTSLLHRMNTSVNNFMSLPSVPWTSVSISLLCGTATHLIWDTFTHEAAPGVAVIPLLHLELFSISGYHFYVFNLLQHSSTFFGIFIILWWIRRWLKRTTMTPTTLPVMLSSTQRFITIGAIILLATSAGLWVGMKTVGSLRGVIGFQNFAGNFVFSALPACASIVIVYSIGWHYWRLHE